MIFVNALMVFLTFFCGCVSESHFSIGCFFMACGIWFALFVKEFAKWMGWTKDE